MMSSMRNPSCEQATGAPAGEVNIEEEEAEEEKEEDDDMLL